MFEDMVIVKGNIYLQIVNKICTVYLSKTEIGVLCDKKAKFQGGTALFSYY